MVGEAVFALGRTGVRIFVCLPSRLQHDFATGHLSCQCTPEPAVKPRESMSPRGQGGRAAYEQGAAGEGFHG